MKRQMKKSLWSRLGIALIVMLCLLTGMLEAKGEGGSGDAIPQIHLLTNDGSGHSYGTSLTKDMRYVPCQITVLDEQGGIVARDLSWKGKVRIRGNTTSAGPKKPYNIKFSQKMDLFGMGKAKKWVLLADLYDPTLMRNELALEFGRYLGLDSAPDFRRVEVWVDGDYRGLYLLTEKIEANKNRVDIDTAEDSGDFLVEKVFDGVQEGDNLYFYTASGRYYRLREPENPSEKKLNRVIEEMNTLEAILASGDWNLVCETIDLDSFAAYYIQNEFFKTIDFGDTSVYFHRKGDQYYGGPGWDFDLSAGNCNAKLYGEFFQTPEGALAADSNYYVCLMQYPEFQREVAQKYLASKEYIHDIYKEGGYLDEQVEAFSGAIQRNNEVWFQGENSYIEWQKVPEATYEGNIEYLRSWMERRDLWLTDYFNGMLEGN